MMRSPSLQTLAISNFRSIDKPITVPLEAPIVLVHGPNGTGKTSIVSALELALTGSMSERPWPETRHLIHRGTSNATIVLTSDGPSARYEIDEDGVTGTPLLGEEDARFLTERCYLAQTTLGRLLETYERAQPRSESPLTRFVKELLGLDHLDALIAGLVPVKDVRNVRRLVPALVSAESQLELSKKEVETAVAEEQGLEREAAGALEEAHRLLATLTPPQELDGDDENAIRQWLAAGDEQPRLVQRIAARQELAALQERWVKAQRSKLRHDTKAAEAGERRTRRALEIWQRDHGAKLENALEALRGELPGLASAIGAGDPAKAHDAAANEVARELAQTSEALADDAERAARIVLVEENATVARARLAAVDEQMTSTGTRTDAEDLAAALAALVPHVHDDDCPVCGRVYREVSDEPLAAHVARRISELTQAAEQLQALARARLEATAQLSTSEESIVALRKGSLDDAAKATLVGKLATLREGEQRLSQLGEPVKQGATLMREMRDAEGEAATARDRDRTASELRTAIAALARAIGLSAAPSADTLGEELELLAGAVKAEIAQIEERQGTRAAVGERLTASRAARERCERLATTANAAKQEHLRSKAAIAEHNRQRARARKLLDAAEAGRSRIVRHVFNESLNTTWRELFVRLAPEERFIPAFQVPFDHERVSANLITTDRDGKPAGSPADMLSAGNLNTAALTLFLALHLSVEPRLPWLLLDDPVQSMDELHISQFTALLRTLAKQLGRRIVIAVHERQLFEYLKLELSPAGPDDRLATIDLTRALDGSTRFEPKVVTYEPDAVQFVA